MSTAFVYFLLPNIYGAMYEAVPQTVLISMSISRENPKSQSLVANFWWPTFALRIFSGFISRWIILLECMYSSAERISERMAKNYSKGNLKSGFCLCIWRRFPISQYSITINTQSSSWYQNKYLQNNHGVSLPPDVQGASSTEFIAGSILRNLAFFSSRFSQYTSLKA